MEFWLPLELFRESQAPCRAVCRPCGFFRMMHGGVSATSCCAFTHRVAFEKLFMLYFSHSRGLFSFKPIAVCTHTQIAPCMPGTSPWVSPVTLSPSFWPGEPRQSLTETRREAGSRASSSLGWDIPLRPCFSESCCLTLPRLWTCLLDE